MKSLELAPNILFVGAIDWDRRMFDELIPLPDGTSYNSYLVVGKDKTALLDTVDPSKEKVLIENLDSLGIKKIDYVISHHAEQDHSGVIPKILELFPMAKVVTNEKCKGMLKDHLLIPDGKFIVVADRETISLGDKTIEFIFTPWVHWPETMSTYLKEDKILFSCDFFGSHFATNDLFAGDNLKILEEAKRYYAEIMMPFRTSIKNNLEKLKGLDIKMIAPSHGPVFDKPELVINAYKSWVSDEMKNEAVILYVSMHGSTKAMVDHLVKALTEKGIEVKLFNMSKTDVGELAMALVDAATVIIGSPTVDAGIHPTIVCAAYLANLLRPKTKYASIVGSFGWGTKIVEQLTAMLPHLKVEILSPVIAKGYPKEADLKLLDALASQIYEKHQSSELIKKTL